MIKFIIPALIALLSVASFADHVSAQSSTTSMSAQKRDALIGQLENVLQDLQNERSMSALEATQTSASNEVEGSLSANSSSSSVGAIGSYSGMGSYGGVGTSLPAVGQSYGYGSLPVQGYATGQAYAAPMVQSAPAVQAAPVYQAAPMAYAAPVVQAAPVQQAPVITSMGPLPDLTLPPINIVEPAPAPIVVQQAAPAPVFQPVFMNYVTPMPMPMPQPRRHKCCLFGR